ncbi:hypothetical protein B0H13DRAFT_889222 [Mycena leptocephala]|nr:hypothetical protein B0H13DRAFT_889222 [Mycena leptocephala]
MPRKAAAADGESAAAEPRRSSRIKDLPRTEVAPKKAPAKPRAKKEVKEGEEGEKPKRGRKRKEAPAENGEEKEEKEPAAKKAKPASKAAPGSKPASKAAKPASKASVKPASRATSKKPASKADGAAPVSAAAAVGETIAEDPEAESPPHRLVHLSTTPPPRPPLHTTPPLSFSLFLSHIYRVTCVYCMYVHSCVPRVSIPVPPFR